MPLERYLVDEVVEDHADGILSRREALRRLALFGLTAAAATSLLAACARSDTDDDVAASPSTTTPPTDALPTEEITFPGPRGTLRGAWATATDVKGAVLVVHENRGLNDHTRSVAGRFAAAGYSALALDLLSEEGGTEEVGDDAQAGKLLRDASEERVVEDMKAALDEIEKRASGAKIAATGFCFGGGMIWLLLHSGEPRLAAAVPFYGTMPDEPDFTGSKDAAVYAIYAEEDTRVTPERPAAESALKRDGLTHKTEVFPGDHAFFNDTGMRYHAESARRAYNQVLAWFETHLA